MARTLATAGTGNGQFAEPNGLLVTLDGGLVASDGANARLQQFGSDLLYKALGGNQVTMIAANATDGLLSRLDLKVLAEQIARVPHITIEANANDEGHLYGSVGAPEIPKALKGKNLKVETDMVRLQGVIKECALYEVDLNLGYDIETKVKVMVVPIKQAEKK